MPTMNEGNCCDMKLILKKVFALFLVFCFLFFSPSVLSIVEAAVSPWTQSNWSGGSGQTAWSDTTKFSSSSNAAVTSTPNRVTFTGSEKLTNTGLESDLTSWTQTPENDTTGVFSSTNFLADTSPVAAWPLGDTTSTQSYSQVFNPATATGRNVAVNGDLELGTTTGWTQGGSATLTATTSSPHAGTYALNITNVTANNSAIQVGITTIGKTYTFTGFVRGDGTAAPAISLDNGGTFSFVGTSSTSWQAFSITAVAVSTNFRVYNTGAIATTVGADDIVITQLSIPASSVTSPTQLLVDGDMETSGTASWTAVNSATLSKQTTNPHSSPRDFRPGNQCSFTWIKGTVQISRVNVYRIVTSIK